MTAPWADLAAVLPGQIVRPHDPSFASETAGYNTSVTHRPEALLRATCAQDVHLGIRFALTHGLPVRVHHTGHGTFASITGGLLICTRCLDHLTIDPRTRIATIGAGVRWNTLIFAAAQHGLAPISGSAGSVGVVGYLLGGGLGPLARSHGFSSDYVVGYSVVTGRGDLIEVDEQQHADLFWALRGGKFGLGVVVAVRLRLIELTTLYGGSLWFSAMHRERVVRGWIDWTRTAADNITTSVAILRFPLSDNIPLPLRGRRLLSLRVAYPGPSAIGERLVAPLRTLAPVHLDTVQDMPASNITQIHNDPECPGPQWVRGQLLKPIDHQFTTALLREIDEAPSWPFAVEIRHLGNATHRDVTHGSAVGGRPAAYAFGFAAIDAIADAAQLPSASDHLLDAIAPWACHETTINFTSVARSPAHRASAWSPSTWTRLEALRRHYDPDGRLHVAHADF
jgi:hypothetical protein